MVSSRQTSTSSGPPRGADDETPPVIITCAEADESTVREAADALRTRGHDVEVVGGAGAGDEALEAAIRRFDRLGLYVLCRSRSLERASIDRLREVLKSHAVPFGRTLTLAVEDGQSRALEERIVSVARRMVTGGSERLPRPASLKRSTSRREPARASEGEEDLDTRVETHEYKVGPGEAGRWADAPLSSQPAAPPEDDGDGPASDAPMPLGESEPALEGPEPEPVAASPHERCVDDELDDPATVPTAVMAPKPVVADSAEPTPAEESAQTATHARLPREPPIEAEIVATAVADLATPMSASPPSGVDRTQVGPSATRIASPPTQPTPVQRSSASPAPVRRPFGLGWTKRTWMLVGGGVAVIALGWAVVAAFGDDEPEPSSAAAAASQTRAPASDPLENEDADAVVVNAAGAADPPEVAPPVEPPADAVLEDEDVPIVLDALVIEDADVVTDALQTRSVRAMDLFLVTAAPTEELTLAGAIAHCDGLEVAGLGGWRVPEIGELNSLNGAKMTTQATFWSATPGDAFGDTRLVLNGRKSRIAAARVAWDGARVLCIRERS